MPGREGELLVMLEVPSRSRPSYGQLSLLEERHPRSPGVYVHKLLWMWHVAQCISLLECDCPSRSISGGCVSSGVNPRGAT
jgi:hypothetical protein